MFSKASNAKKPPGTDTLIGQATKLEGQLDCETDLRIEGTVKGDVTSSRDVTIGETGVVESNMRAANVIIAGTMNGDVDATGMIVIEQTGRLNGNTCCSAFIIKEGGHFNGTSRMSVEALDKQSGKAGKAAKQHAAEAAMES
ncbi:bactofilin family protein [Paenibacillus apiarius]|uniref:Polymer-forming cytoskeletal protein n=1 Tax=Paenibacillus apiarius TaxID=46240 RepID=A0ABT4DYS5_9BACL|nr:polymer-forming cytoskeletal protein [Paenibacillus apiarius]MCY9516512.1 polymer-forming cytoskeletal protein [Paenibacillus apiarius]MCY9522503.1 polymer-forming cytoskeletal protein [Paenibacillus apiarius]MCY9554573.1 polymer-forming cytoskeletal protein [Paenibacillus apiarius]MCY9556689.1 polymer-forming cytoskeletal protein [Paenibacillus apiarius]MCY9686630.1 polymer-forming cytoskeletal protein [Paenibacillus apiarius]